jgi:hypothetical protein
MKNKKGGKAQKYLNTISKQTATSGKSKEEVSLGGSIQSDAHVLSDGVANGPY